MLRLPPHNTQHVTFMHPFQCDLQPQRQETHRTSLRHHSPSSPLPFVTTPLHHHFPSSPLPFLTTSLLHHFPSSPLPFITTPLLNHFPSSPLPFFTTSLRHHFPSSPLPVIITSLLHHFPSSPLPFIIASLLHPPCVTASSSSFVMYCYVIYHPSSRFFTHVLLCSVKSHTTLHQGQFFPDVLS